MSVERKVDTEKLRQVVSFMVDSALFSLTTLSVQWIEVEDPSNELLNNTNYALRDCMIEIEESVKNLNDYLNSVADAFEAKDAELAKSISEASIDAGKSRVSRIANNPVFNNTYYD